MADPMAEAVARSRRRKAVAILRAASDWVPGRELARRLGLRSTRDLRRLVIWPLRARCRVPVHYRPGPGGGYKLRVTPEEHRACLATARRMGRDHLAIAAHLQRDPADVVAAQLVMDWFPARELSGPQDGLDMLLATQARRGHRLRWPDVLAHLLGVLTQRPEVYAAELAQVREILAASPNLAKSPLRPGKTGGP